MKRVGVVLFFFIFLQATAVRGGFFESLSNFNKKNRAAVTDQMQNFHEVDHGKFYRSQQLTPELVAAYLKKHGIKTLISLRGENEPIVKLEKDVALALGVRFESIAMSAAFLSPRHELQQLLKLYDEVPRPILVHCWGGADRTGEAAALWVLEVMKKSKDEALKQLAITYGHRKFVNSAKDFLISIWGGREWLQKTYNHSDYIQFCRPSA